MKYWEIIADNLSKVGWSWTWVSVIDSNERTIWIADPHRDEKRFVMRADEKLIAFWNSNLRSVLAANWFDRLARFLANSASLSRSESGGGQLPR